MNKLKNKYIAFHGKNEQAVQVYRDLKRIAHEKDLFIWQVIRDGLEALEKMNELSLLSDQQLTTEKLHCIVFDSPDSMPRIICISDLTKKAISDAVESILTAQNEPE